MDDNAIHLHIKHWYAWAPGIENATQWRQWSESSLALAAEGVPKLPFIKPMLRRRLSSLSKMTVKAAFECLNQEAEGFTADRVVFCSRHGELNRTVGLLESLVGGEELSPTGFSLSVHNAASGLYSIARNDTAPSVSIAAGRDTLVEGVREASGLLVEEGVETVLVVIADEPLPDYLSEFADEDQYSFALAVLLTRNKAQSNLRVLPVFERKDERAQEEPQALQLIRLLASDVGDTVMQGARCDWLWGRDD